MKKTIDEVRDWLLENRVDGWGVLDLSGLDFSDFDGNVLIDSMKVKKSLIQSYQNVGGNLRQSNSKVLNGNLYQGTHKVGGDLYQRNHKVEGDLFQGESKIFGNYWSWGNEVAGRIEEEGSKKLLKKITLKELEELGYELEEER